jgi:hypothetical protein
MVREQTRYSPAFTSWINVYLLSVYTVNVFYAKQQRFIKTTASDCQGKIIQTSDFQGTSYMRMPLDTAAVKASFL